MIKRTAPCLVATLVLLLHAAPPLQAASDQGGTYTIALSAGAASPGSLDKPALVGGEGSWATGPLLGVTATGLLMTAMLIARRRSRRVEPVRAGRATVAAAEAAIPTISASVPLADDGPVLLVRPLPPMRELIPPVNPSLLDDDEGRGPRTAPDEQGIPRWLRPSVREARFAYDRDHRRSSWG